ncbi:MAG: site-2 protease family protein [Paludibacteraceae bacterium]|nr:site-2 protease family protein [Paludibacteraceae bacterium]
MIQALQLILALSFLVVIHELGHFTFAKIFHVRVEKFYMFFNPWISLLRAKKFNGRWHFAFFSKNLPMTVKDSEGERPMTEAELAALPEDDWRRYPDNTEWGIGWLPFGGYCAIGGMVDETHKTEDLSAEPQPWEFRSKPAWQRLLIILGGILVNFIAALVIFSMVLWTWGKDEMPLRNAQNGLYYSELLQQEGFRQQDKILSIDGQEPEELGDVVQLLIIEGRRDVRVLRGTDTVQLRMSEDLGERYLAIQNDFDRAEREKARHDDNYQRTRYILIQEYVPFVIDSVMPDNVGYLAGLQRGDSIVRIDSAYCGCQAEVQNQLRLHPLDTIEIGYYRAGQYRTTRAFLGDQCKLGVIMRSKYEFIPVNHTDYTFFQAIPAGIQYGWDMLTMYVKQFRLVFTKEGAQSLGGFGAIGQMFPSFWDWYAFWHMTAFLSLILAFMNFLPIPALDGGYILFLLVEMITRRKPNDKFLERANEVGFWLLIALLILANGNDILKIFF